MGQMHGQSQSVLVRPYSRIAEAYDAITGVADFRQTRKAFERLVRYHGIKFDSAVDVGCGTGLFACYLDRCWGVPVFGVDRSPEMLAEAARNCASSGVCFLLQDFRRLCLPRPVELATANTYTLNHLMSCTEMRRVFRRIHDNLRAGGHFIFDLITDRQPLHSARGYTRRLRLPGREILHHVRWNPARKTLSVFIVQGSRHSQPPIAEMYVGRGYSLLEVGRCLRSAGFLLRGIYDAETVRVAVECPAKAIVIALRR